jgi:hypothetical protein
LRRESSIIEDIARSPVFASLQQKNASSYVTIMWLQDPFKAKWTILVGKPKAPLDQFLILFIQN